MSKKKEIINDMNNENFPYYLQLYEEVNETQRYEGSGIWSRFNIIISLNIILFGILTFIISIDAETARLLFIVVSLSGSLFSLWSIYVLRRLWVWHSHWKSTLQEIEKKFPSDFPKPFTSRPNNLKKSNSWFQSWLLSYTQPFILVLFFMWATLFILSVNGILFVDKSDKEKTQIEILLKNKIKQNDVEIKVDTTIHNNVLIKAN